MEKDKSAKLGKCPAHKREHLLLYCEDCDQSLCSMCVASQEHAGHVLHSIKDQTAKQFHQWTVLKFQSTMLKKKFEANEGLVPEGKLAVFNEAAAAFCEKYEQML